MKLRLWQVDAFTNRRMSGNPAAVVPLEAWLPDETLLAIAAENNLSETAYLVNDGGAWRIRWFTPATEVPLCGHATLASAHVLFTHLAPGLASVTFASASGPLTVTRDGSRLVLDFPAYVPERVHTPRLRVYALGAEPLETWVGRKMMAVFATEADVRALAPDFRLVARIEAQGVIATAPGGDCDFVSRYFVPQMGIDEDPVTGSAHCLLTPYWANRLGRAKLHARQVSRRGGELWCESRGERVAIAGEAVDYLAGTIEV